MYRLGVEMILGLQRAGEHLEIHPNIPREWTQYQISYRFERTLYHIVVKQQKESSGEHQVTMDGKLLKDGLVPLKDDGEPHEVMVYV
jgi:cellobiose phosphorylase